MTHGRILKKVAAETGLKPTEVDSVIEKYFLEVAKATQEDLEKKRTQIGVHNIIRRSASITNKNVGCFWTRYDIGADGKNDLGMIEKAIYPRLKVRFSKSFYDKAFTEPSK